MKKKILGLDLGVASLGWAISALDENDQWYIEDFGVRLWKPSEESKTLSSKTASRRDFRSQRRLIRRKQQRINDIKNIFIKYNLLTGKEIENHLTKLTKENNDYSSENDELNPLKLRNKGLEEKLTNLQLFIVVYNISKRRGYENLFSIEKEDRLNTTRELIKKYQYPIKVILYEKNGIYRNKGDDKDYLLFLRSDYKKELEKILITQIENKLISKEIKKEIFDVVFRQRFFEEGTNSKKFSKEEFEEKLKSQGQNYYPTWHDAIGNCTFYTKEKRLTRNSIFSDLFVIYNELSKITERLENNKRSKIFEYVTKEFLQKIDFSEKIVREAFEKENVIFEGKKEGVSYEIKKNLFLFKLNKFNKDWVINELRKIDFNVFEINETNLEKFGELLGDNVTPQKIINEIENNGLNFIIKNSIEETLEQITKQGFSSGRINVSKKYILDLVEEVIEVGTNLGKFNDEILSSIKKDSIKSRFEKIDSIGVFSIDQALKNTFLPNINDPDMKRNAVVYRSINQTRLVIRALLKKYETFDVINFEVARDLYAAINERKNIKGFQEKNEKENLRITEEIQKLGEKPTFNNIEKFKLWEQQRKSKADIFAYDFYDVSLQTKIELKNLFSGEYEIDHIMPYSVENDNTNWNKVLTSRNFNQKKGKRTPIEFFKTLNLENEKKDIEVWKKEIKNFELFKGKQKQKETVSRKLNYLFAISASRTNESNFETKDLNDIRYISKYFRIYFEREFEIYSSLIQKECPKINAIKGKVTSSFRREWLRNDSNGELNPWGVESKVRNITPYHHSVDAIILSQFEGFSQIEFLTFFVNLEKYQKFLKRQLKVGEITIENAKEQLEDTINELLKSSKKIFVLERNKERLISFNNQLILDLKNKSTKILKTFMKPLVKTLSDDVIKLIPMNLIIEEIDNEIIYEDKETGKEKTFIRKEKIAKFEKEIYPEEWSQLNNRDINLFPWPSYKIEKRIRGTTFGSELPVSKEKSFDKKGNFDSIKFYKDKNGTIWDKSKYIGVDLTNESDPKFINVIDIQNDKSRIYKKILSYGMIFTIDSELIDDRYVRYTGKTGDNIISPSIFKAYNGEVKYNNFFEKWPRFGINKLKNNDNFKIIQLSILGKSQ